MKTFRDWLNEVAANGGGGPLTPSGSNFYKMAKDDLKKEPPANTLHLDRNAFGEKSSTLTPQSSTMYPKMPENLKASVNSRFAKMRKFGKV